MWCWRRLLRVPWTARISNQSFLKEINSEYSLEGWILKLKLQYFGYWCEELTHWKRPWCWKRLKTKRKEGGRGWDGWMASLTWWTWVWVNSGTWWWTGRLGMLQSMESQRVGHDWMTELNWTDPALLWSPENHGETRQRIAASEISVPGATVEARLEWDDKALIIAYRLYMLNGGTINWSWPT